MNKLMKIAGYVLLSVWVIALSWICFVNGFQVPMWGTVSVTLMGLIPYAILHSSYTEVSESETKIRNDRKYLLLEVTLIAWLVVVGFAFVSAALERGTTVTHYSNITYLE